MRWAEIALITSLEASDAVTDILISEGCGGVATQAPSVPFDEDTTTCSLPVSGRVGEGSSGVPVYQVDSVDGVDSLTKEELTAYFPVDDRLPATLERVKSRIHSLSDFDLNGADAEITVKFVEDEDWATAWKSFFKPLVVGRVVIKPTWEDFDPTPDQLIVELDPGMAFGTGNHPTTQMCLLAIQRYLRQGDTMLDVGTGSGILAAAAALLGASKVVGVEIDPVAVKAARENVEANGVGDIAQILEGDSPAVGGVTADLVTANIVASAILDMKQELADALKPGGTLIVSGVIDTRGDEVQTGLNEIGLETVEVMRDGEWVSVISRKTDNRQPLTTHRFFVDPEQISGKQVVICGPQARQICSVLRLQAGDDIAVLDGSGCCHIARIEATGKEVVAGIAETFTPDTEPRVKLTLAQALPKGDKAELIVQKSTELGISEIVVFTSERTIPKPAADRVAHKLARWESIAREAAEQSFRATIPTIAGILGYADLLSRVQSFDKVLVAWEDEANTLLAHALEGVEPEDRVMLIVGPEGGFSGQEVSQLTQLGGRPVSFGKRILRTETAAIAGCAIVIHCLEV